MPDVQMTRPAAGLTGAPHLGERAPAGAGAAGPRRDFAEVLGARLGDELRFSAHARARLASREIPLSDSEHERLARAASEAAKHGAREALLVMGGMGFIVSVPNRTVITALDDSRMEAGVITGIDATVMVPGE